ncbi:threonine aldolase 1 [Prunus dulcis]|uniref:Threonine aldolase 1 n=1 Tax=Prunus dulcis TaxID=3755 RepID=A0A4Y1RY89_PRUDU|nr:threonine aldolase 1 [Prunus dulcis]
MVTKMVDLRSDPAAMAAAEVHDDVKRLVSALVALHENVANLDTDHKRAKILAGELNISSHSHRALTGGHDENGNYTWDNTSSTLLCVSNMISSTFEHAIIQSLPNL